jgi:sugar-specific transcriptional regulator TrmB
MYQEILESLDLSPNESKIYESLVEKGECSISDISTASQTHRRNTYDAIKRLIDKGLVFEIFSGSGNKYNAVEPDKLKEVLDEKEQKLISILPELKRKFQQRFAPEEAYIYRGLEGQKNIFRDILRVGQDSYGIGGKGEWFDLKLEIARQGFFKEANRKKIKFFIIYDNEIKKTASNFIKTWPGNLQARFLPKEYSTNSNLHIFGDYIVSYTNIGLFKTPENIVMFIIRSHDLAESYRKWFWYMWEKAEK